MTHASSLYYSIAMGFPPLIFYQCSLSLIGSLSQSCSDKFTFDDCAFIAGDFNNCRLVGLYQYFCSLAFASTTADTVNTI